MNRVAFRRKTPRTASNGPSHPRGERSLPRRQTGFPDVVKLACRARAGQGDVHNAACEACGEWLGLYGGEVRPRLGHDVGSCAPGVVSGPVNAVLLCGGVFPMSGCAGRAWALDPEMEARGFLIRAGSGPRNDPRRVPVMSGGPDAPEITAWLGEDGGYLLTPPDVTDAVPGRLVRLRPGRC